MNTKRDGGPAFPTMNSHQNGPNTYHFAGMTLRDYFAAKVMQGICAGRSHADLKGHAIVSAKIAYGIADEMLKARETK